jgi:hypothetical protein
MSETVINIVMLGFIIAAVVVGVFSPLLALLMAFWKWYRESGDPASGHGAETPHASAAQR